MSLSSGGDARRILAEIQEVSCRALLADPPHIQRIPEEFFFRQFPRGRIEDLPDLGFLNHVVERGFRNEHSLWFTHQSFQEYLAARWIAEQWERGDEGLIDKVVTECWKPHLEEPLKFLAGLKGAAFIKRLYPGPACDNLIHARLFLAAA